MPVYNVEPYLEACVKSILTQSFTDFELLLVNDASTDGSLAVARGFENDKRVKVLDKPHGGLGDTRNYGVRFASGKYLLFIDSDDWVDDDMFRNLVAAAEGCDAELVVFNFVRENLVDGEQRVCSLPVSYPEFGDEIRSRMLEELVGPDPDDGDWRRVEMLGCAWRRMYLRSWFTENGIVFGNEQKVMLEDLPASIQAHCLATRVLLVGGAYYHYRYNPDSLSTRYRPHKMEMLTGCFQTVREILTKRGIYGCYEERHLAWFVRMAVHSSLVNCFCPANPAGYSGRFREVRGILQNPIFRSAVRSDYLLSGGRADRVLLRVLRTRWTPLVYGFYSLYSRALFRNGGKK